MLKTTSPVTSPARPKDRPSKTVPSSRARIAVTRSTLLASLASPPHGSAEPTSLSHQGRPLAASAGAFGLGRVITMWFCPEASG